jgi:hypothetical protein
MTTEIQTTITPKTAEINPTTSTINSRADFSIKMSSTLEERKGNAIKPLSLRPNRSVKKNTSLKPLGLRSRS